MDTKRFWENRFSQQGVGLRATGHRAFDTEYNRWFYQAQAECLDDLLDSNHISTQNASLLDIGCGGGFFIEYFRQKGVAAITGADITHQSIQYLQKAYPTFKFYEADISNATLPFEGQFDLVTAISVMFHIVDDEKFTRALQNMTDLLRPGGSLIICDTFTRPKTYETKHVRTRPLEDYTKIFSRNNVKVCDLKPCFYFLNRVYVPFIGPRIISAFKLGHMFYTLDKRLRLSNKNNGSGVKFLLAQKGS